MSIASPRGRVWWSLCAWLLVACGGEVAPPEATPDAPVATACDPNPCTEAHKTTCTGSGLCSCDLGFMDGAGGACVPTAGAPYDQVKQWVAEYKAAHPGNGGKDWDINTKTADQIAADPAAKRLLDLCGDLKLARPVIPPLAWEYGGMDHPWINPGASPLVVCVYIPVNPSSSHWMYGANHVVADTWVLFPDANPCATKLGAAQVADCIGDVTNFEILVDIASLNDGVDVGLTLAEATTDLNLIPPGGGAPVVLFMGI